MIRPFNRLVPPDEPARELARQSRHARMIALRAEHESRERKSRALARRPARRGSRPANLFPPFGD